MSRRTAGEPLPLGGGDARRIFGLEHEYRVLEDTRQIDFRAVLHDLSADGLRLDPTDPNAYRCAWGGLLTADGPEAEVAIAPVPLVAGCTYEVERRAVEARQQLSRVLPDAFALDGYSTHLSVELHDDHVDKAARLFAVHYSPAMMLLLDKETSPGLLVRPRASRLEIGGEHTTGAHLRAATTFATAGALACGSAARSRRARRRLPTAMRGRIQPSRIRSGWYIDRNAFGDDLYRHVRDTVLRDRFGRQRTADAQLVETWDRTRPYALAVFDKDEVGLVDRIVERRAPLPIEDPRFDEVLPDLYGPATERSPFERVGRPHCRPGFRVEPRSIAWNAVVFDILDERTSRTAIACIPRRVLDEFLLTLDAGTLDGTIDAFLASPSAERTLVDASQAGEPQLFDGIGRPDAVVPPERGGHGLARLGGSGGGSPADSRRDKSRRPPPRRGRLIVGAAVVVAVVAIAGVALAARSNSSDTQAVSAVTLGTDSTVPQPSASVSTAASDAGSPLTVDACSLLSEGDIKAYADSIGGDYHAQPPFLPSPTGSSSKRSDPAKQRFCTWRFLSATADGSASADAEVDVVVDKLDKEDIDRACHLLSTSGPVRVFDGVGDHAEATSATGCVRVGDVTAHLLYGGVTQNLTGDSAVIEHLLAVLASGLGDTPPPPATTPVTDPAPVTEPAATVPPDEPPSGGGGVVGPIAHGTEVGTG